MGGVGFVPIYKVLCGEKFEQDRRKYERDHEEREISIKRRITNFARVKH